MTPRKVITEIERRAEEQGSEKEPLENDLERSTVNPDINEEMAQPSKEDEEQESWDLGWNCNKYVPRVWQFFLRGMDCKKKMQFLESIGH